MTSIYIAKKKLAEQYKETEGFVGVGIGQVDGRDYLHLYIANEESVLVTIFRYKPTYEGYPVNIHILGKIQAY